MEIKEITTWITTLIIGMSASFILGLYVCTQISHWIDKRIKKK